MGELKDIMLAFLAINDQMNFNKGKANNEDFSASYIEAQKALALRYMQKMASMMRVRSSEKGAEHLCDAVYLQVEKTHEAIKQSFNHKDGTDKGITATIHREPGNLEEQFRKED